MELDKAKELLPYFQLYLTNKISIKHSKKIIEIFVGFEDFRLTQAMYCMGHRIDSFLIVPTDKGKFTLGAAFTTNEFVSVKKIVQEDNLFDLIQAIESLDYMSYREYDHKQDSNVSVYV